MFDGSPRTCGYRNGHCHSYRAESNPGLIEHLYRSLHNVTDFNVKSLGTVNRGRGHPSGWPNGSPERHPDSHQQHNLPMRG